MEKNKQTLLRQLPGVDRIIEAGNAERRFEDIPKSVLVSAIRSVVDALRSTILNSPEPVTESRLSVESIVADVVGRYGAVGRCTPPSRFAPGTD